MKFSFQELSKHSQSCLKVPALCSLFERGLKSGLKQRLLEIKSLKGLATKLKIYYELMAMKSTKLRNTILSDEEILGGRVPAGKQGL